MCEERKTKRWNEIEVEGKSVRLFHYLSYFRWGAVRNGFVNKSIARGAHITH